MKSISFHENYIKSAYSFSGFTELKDIFEEEQTVIMTVADISERMRDKYNFTSSKISGIIMRAVQKGLLYKTGRGTCVINIDYPEGVADYIDEKEPEKPNIQVIISEEINTCIENINKKVNVSDLSSSDFEKLKNVMAQLKALA